MASVEAKYGFNQLRALTVESKYNMGELRLNRAGDGFEKVNNHVHLTSKNIVKLDDGENIEVRKAVYSALNGKFGGKDASEGCRKALSEIKERLTGDDSKTLSISRDEVAELIRQLESVAGGKSEKLSLADFDRIGRFKRADAHVPAPGKDLIRGLGKGHDDVVLARTVNGREDLGKRNVQVSDSIRDAGPRINRRREELMNLFSRWLGDGKGLEQVRKALANAKKMLPGQPTKGLDALLAQEHESFLLWRLVNRAVADHLRSCQETANENDEDDFQKTRTSDEVEDKFNELALNRDYILDSLKGALGSPKEVALSPQESNVLKLALAESEIAGDILDAFTKEDESQPYDSSYQRADSISESSDDD